MARPQNIKIDGSKLDEVIRKLEGTKFNQKKISQFIMGKNSTYYCQSIKEGHMSEEVLDRVCEYYELDKKDYVVTEAIEKQQIQKQADTHNYDNLILLLTSVDRTMKELLAQEKATQFTLNEILNEVKKSNGQNKQVLDKLDAVVKSDTAKQNTYGKFRSVH